MSRVDFFVLGLRTLAVITIILVVPALWRLMVWLPWQVDCLIAAVAAFAFAYRFEHEDRPVPSERTRVEGPVPSERTRAEGR